MSEPVITPEEARRLRAPFPPAFVKRRQGRGNATFAYITARDVMDRLDAVIGPGDWSDSYAIVHAEAFAVECRLTVRGVTRADVGYPNNPEWEEDKEPEKLKAAYSDALKRAAVKFGIGRFLYGPSSIQQFAEDIAEVEGGLVANRPAAPAGRTAARAATLGGALARPDSRPVLLATESQVKAIYSVARGNHGMDDDAVNARCERQYSVSPFALSRRQASEFIDALKARPNSQGSA